VLRERPSDPDSVSNTRGCDLFLLASWRLPAIALESGTRGLPAAVKAGIVVMVWASIG